MIVILVASYAPNAFIPLTNPLQYKTETFGENYQVSGTTDKQTARKNVYLSKKSIVLENFPIQQRHLAKWEYNPTERFDKTNFI